MTQTLPARTTVLSLESAAARWFPAAQLPSTAPLRLICFSYAGGTPSVFRDWHRFLRPGVDIIRVLRPGRCTRLGEQPYTQMQPLVEAIADALVAADLARDYAVFGHSMGALVGYEVSCELRSRGYPEPLHLFVSGSKAPQMYGREANHMAADKDLCRLVRDLGGVAASGADGEDSAGLAYLKRRLPVLRADLAACERYRWTPRPPLGCPVTAFRGSADPIASASQVEAWREYSSRSFVQRTLPGNHFFLTGARQLLLGHLRADLSRIRASRAADDHLYLQGTPACPSA
jgi:surfactin synthase thioesterase subunit